MHDTSSALSAFDIAAILVVASALLGWFNHHFIKLPHVIGLTVMGALTAIGLMIANAFIPAITLGDWVADILRQLNFTETLLQGMLSFLLFAGALHVDLDRLKVAWLPVLLLSTVGVIVSTVLVGLAMWGVGLLLALPVAPIWYFVFGALIAPTDPVSVLGVLREENVPQSLQSAVAGDTPPSHTSAPLGTPRHRLLWALRFDSASAAHAARVYILRAAIRTARARARAPITSIMV